nr:E3 binding domain-containing protein [Betaproteobacteria bacterium]
MSEIKQVLIPDIGDFKDVPVIEVLVKSGDQVKVEDSLITLESDKATIEVPAPYPGVITEVSVKTGDKVSEGSLILLLQVSDPSEEKVPNVSDASEQPVTKTPPIIATAIDAKIKQEIIEEPLEPLQENKILDNGVITKVHAGPSVRRFARELGVNLNLVTGSGPKQRILKEDVQAYVKAELSKSQVSDDGGVALNL